MREWLVPLVIFSAMGLFWLFGYITEKRRRKKLVACAQELDIEYLEELPQIDARHFSAFPISSSGDQRRTGISFIADNGQLRIVIFDFGTVSGSGKSKDTRDYALGLVTSSSFGSPGMYITSNSWSLKLTNFFAKKTIELESDPQFSNDFRILGDEPEKINQFLTQARRDVLRQSRFKSFSSFRDMFLIELEATKIKPSEVRNYLSTCLSLAKVMSTPSK